MATAQKSRSQQSTGSWSSIFPTEQVTQQQSALFVKKLLAVAVSNITYLRAIFPEHAFGDRCLEDLNLKILRDDSTCPGACQVIKWVKGCFDALDKRYLKTLIIGIYVDPDQPDTVIESYTFKFAYTNDGEIDTNIYKNDKLSGKYSTSETRKATTRLLRTILVLTQTLKSLPDDVMMTVKLLYYDDVTPADYEPPGFQAADQDHFNYSEEPMNIKVGDVATPFHTVKLRITTDRKQFEVEDEAADEELLNPAPGETQTKIEKSIENVPKDVYDFDDDVSMAEASLPPLSCTRKQQQTPLQCADIPLQQAAEPGSCAISTTGSLVADQLQSQEEEFGALCSCGCNEDDGLMILCSSCKYWQHGVCYKIIDENTAPSDHVCIICENTNHELGCTDPTLVGLSEVAVQATCLWRRALLACTEMNRILVPNFARRLGVQTTVAQGLINRLEKEGFLSAPSKGKRLGKIVNKESLKKNGMKKYFSPPSHEAEMLSKTSQRDPSQQVSAKRDQDQQSSKTSTVQNKDVDREVEKLVGRTEEINLQGQRKTKKGKAQDNKKETKEVETIITETPARKGRKRARSVVDQSEFEICESQIDVEEDEPSSKKKKTSEVKKPIKV